MPLSPLPSDRPVPLVLGSASPARLKTLRAAGVEPTVLVSEVDEDRVVAEALDRYGPLGPVAPGNVIDGTYERFWAGTPGRARWELTLRLPSPRLLDRLH